jgi:hypothetical protein
MKKKKEMRARQSEKWYSGGSLPGSVVYSASLLAFFYILLVLLFTEQ